MSQQVCVVGGGVIGLSTAYALVRAGCSVTVLEAGTAVGHGSSFANGGQLSYRYVSPLADAGVPLKALQWLLSADAPLRLRLRCDRQQWRWLWQFLCACRRSLNQRHAGELLRLALLSQQTLAHWQQDGLAGFDWRENGKLVLYRTASALAQASRQLLPGQQLALSPAACLQREPALQHVLPQLAGGIFTPGDAVADCYQFCLRLQEALQQSGRCRLHYGQQVTHFARRGQHVLAACTASEQHAADAFVLATACASRELLAPLGYQPMIYPLKGYSLTLPLTAGHVAPELSVTDIERKTVYARLGDRLRIAAMVDIDGYERKLSPARLACLQRIARETFPQAGDFSRAAAWVGLRPATPDGLPLLGACAAANLWLNLGHGALGFTLAAGSARLLSQMVTGGQPDIDVRVFQP